MTCGTCVHYIEAGDDYCCRKEVRRLCFSHTKSCDQYESWQEVVEQKDERIAELEETLAAITKRRMDAGEF